MGKQVVYTSEDKKNNCIQTVHENKLEWRH